MAIVDSSFITGSLPTEWWTSPPLFSSDEPLLSPEKGVNINERGKDEREKEEEILERGLPLFLLIKGDVVE
ncbi:MAG: hypothetical protein V3S02_03245 [Dehalococcoidales bacterium]